MTNYTLACSLGEMFMYMLLILVIYERQLKLTSLQDGKHIHAETNYQIRIFNIIPRDVLKTTLY